MRENRTMSRATHNCFYTL